MNSNKKVILIFLFIVIITSCNNKDSLKLTVLNKSLRAYCPNGDCNEVSLHFDSTYNKKSNNIIKLKFENNSNYNYIINTLCLSSYTKGCSYQETFPDEKTPLSIGNISIINTRGEAVKIESILYQENPISERAFSYIDSLNQEKYESLGYYDTSWNFKNYALSKKLIVVKAGESLFFEVSFKLPLGKYYFVKLNPEEKYSGYLIFHSDTTGVKKYLTWTQLKNMEENNYKLYHGTIKSNSIPITFDE